MGPEKFFALTRSAQLNNKAKMRFQLDTVDHTLPDHPMDINICKARAKAFEESVSKLEFIGATCLACKRMSTVNAHRLIRSFIHPFTRR